MSQINAVFRRNSVDVTGNKTLTAADQGIVQNVTATSTITLPAAAAGLEFVVRVGADNITVTVTTGGTDTVQGNGFTAAANKGPVSTTQRQGDEVTLSGGSGTYNLVQVQGVWTRQL